MLWIFREFFMIFRKLFAIFRNFFGNFLSGKTYCAALCVYLTLLNLWARTMLWAAMVQRTADWTCTRACRSVRFINFFSSISLLRFIIFRVFVKPMRLRTEISCLPRENKQFGNLQINFAPKKIMRGHRRQNPVSNSIM